ncbi:MAG: Type 1 glutamine amidotransferase-like domain-containing protein [Anaerolineales bacterium]
MRQIIAMGHGGFSMEESLLDRYILDQTDKERPRVCFLAQASSESPDYTIKFYGAFARLGARPTHLSLFRLPTADLASFLLEQDVIYVSGGNTRSMLALWREWELDTILRQAWEQGVLLTGLSAGAICWFEEGVTDSVPGELGPLECLGYLAGSCCPHYDGEPERRPAFHRLIGQGALLPGYGLEDGVALHVIDDQVEKVVSALPGATAYYVAESGGEVQEQALQATYLGEQS